MRDSVGSWAHEVFGERAGHVRQAVVVALRAALADAQDAQREGKSGLLYTFGWTLASRRHERLVEALGDLEDVELIKPPGSPHHLVLLGDTLLYPFRYARDDATPITAARVTDRRVSGLVAELFQRFGQAPTHEELPFPMFAPEDGDTERDAVRPALAKLPPSTRLVLVAFAGNDRAGLLNAWWGEAELLDGSGHVRWIPGRLDPLPVNAPAAGALPRPARQPQPVGSRFDSGAMPAVSLTARPPIERADMFPDIPRVDEKNR